MQLNELFKNDKADFEYESDSYTTSWQAKTNLTNGNRLIIYCDQAELTRSNPVWQIAFKVGGSFGKTGDGNEIEVFKKVSFLLSKFLEEKKPKNITMTSKGGNRTALYKRLFKRVIPSWNMVVHQSGSSALISFSQDNTLPIFTDPTLPMAWIWLGDQPFGMAGGDGRNTDSYALMSIYDDLSNIEQAEKHITDGSIETELEKITSFYDEHVKDEEDEE